MVADPSPLPKAELPKRERVLVEATKMFSRFGFRKTSIDEIAKEAGVGKGTVYLAAESKEDLFYQVLHREVRSWQAACAKIIDPRVQADELLMRLYLEAHRHLSANVLVRDLFQGEVSKMLPKWVDRFEELRALGRMNVEEILRIGVRQRVFRPDLAVEEVAIILQDLNLAGSILHPTLSDEVKRARAAVAFDIVLNGIRASKSK